MKRVTGKFALLLSIPALAAILVYVLASCGGSSADDGGTGDGSASECSTGDVRVCACPTGENGYQLCGTTGKWTDCQGCGASPDTGSVDYGPIDVGVYDGGQGSDASQDAGADSGVPDAGADAGTDGGQPVAACSDLGGNLGWMCEVPAGGFWMGCNTSVDYECFNDEYPYHNVTLSEYKVDRDEVTVGRYQACVTAAKCSAPGSGGTCNWGVSGRSAHPINCVSWDQAKAYCSWAGKRLPTEAEWEKASRGIDGRKYPWGSTGLDCNHAVWNGAQCSNTGTQPVGSKAAGVSPYGANDTVGNVWEWVSDWYDSSYYNSSPDTDPTGPADGTARVLKGGSWNYEYTYFERSSVRNHLEPVTQYPLAGFRCAFSGSLPDGGFPDAGSDAGVKPDGSVDGGFDGGSSDAGQDGGIIVDDGGPDGAVADGSVSDAGWLSPDASYYLDGGLCGDLNKQCCEGGKCIWGYNCQGGTCSAPSGDSGVVPVDAGI
jgi:formylglycine-generating enzyme required for sulfatase activity